MSVVKHIENRFDVIANEDRVLIKKLLPYSLWKNVHTLKMK